MKFSDYTDEELTGKDILLQNRSSRRLSKITKVTKTQITDERGNRYKKDSFGTQIGTSCDVWNMVTAELISSSEADLLRKEWGLKKQVSTLSDSLVKQIQEIKETLSEYNFAILKQIKELLDKSVKVK